MRHILVLSLLLLMVASPVRAYSPLEGRQVRHYTVNDGLASNAVYSFCQDSKGRMWFGTIDGLHSFDGYEVREYRDENIPTLGSVISCIMEDDRQCLWLGSGSGVALYDLRKERFREVPVDPVSGVRIKSSVSGFMTDKNGDVWISTVGEGVFRYVPETKRLTQYPGAAKIAHDIARTVIEDSSGDIWAGTQEGLCRYNPAQDRFVPVGGDEGRQIHVTVIYEDQHHNLWIGSRGKGLFLYDRVADRFIPKLKPENEHSVFLVRSIVEWLPGQLLVASDWGLTCFDIETGFSETVTSNPNSNNSLNDNYLQSLFVDKEGALWIGTYFGGVNYVSPEKKMFRHYHKRNSSLVSGIVSMFAKADGNNLWIGTDDAGVSYWNRETGVFTKLNDHPLLNGSAHKNIHALLQDGDLLFVGMYLGGLNVVNLKTGDVKNHILGEAPNTLYSSSIYSIYKDSYGEVWIGTTMGLNKYRKDTGDFERVFEVHPADVCYMLEDKRGYMWACTIDNGVFRLDRKTGKWEQFSGKEPSSGLPLKSIVTATCDDSGNLWFGTDGGGMLRFDYETDRFIKVKLPNSVRVVNKIIAHKSDLWLATTKGLLCYNPKSGVIHLFNRDSGLQDNVFLPNSGILTADGHVMMGGINGFNEFDPDRIEPHYSSPEVILSDFQIFNNPVEIGGEGSPLAESITYAEKIELDDNQRVISFKVSPISYVNPSQNRYLYKLEGFDKDWNEAMPRFPHTYTNLPAGDYVFKVRTADGNGGWNDESVNFSMKVLPPWWKSTPMIVFYIVVLVAAGWFVYARMMRKQKEKLRKLADHKDRELYQSKMEFFTHIVHEIRTPLTLIISPLENILCSKGSISDCRSQLMVMDRNARRLLSLVNHLMDFRKMESGMVKLHMENVDLRGILSQICQNFVLTAALKHLDVKVDIEDSPCVANIDNEAFRQIVDNLLSNALKFSRSEIVISLHHADGGKIILSVKNNGPDIPAEEHVKIFTPFYQIAQHRPTDNIGTGLGLLLVKKYAGLMNAEVELVSSPGMGAEFRVVFLQSGAAPDDVAEVTEVARISKEAETDEEVAGIKTGKPRVLVVDDNADMLGFLSDMLAEKYEVSEAPGADIALKIIEGEEPDLIISDVMMPGTDGMEFCRIVKRNIHTSHIPVVLLTAKVDNSDFVTGFDSGADLYVTKPFSPEVLMAQIRSLLANRAVLKDKFKDNPSIIADMVPDSSPDKEFFTKIKKIVEERLADPDFSVDVLAREAAISRTGLFTKLKSIAGMTPNDYIRQIRLQKAAELLLQNRLRVSEVCWQVGFSSRSHFAKCFQAQFGVSPSEYKGIRQ